MRVKCVANKGSRLSDISIKTGNTRRSEFPLIIGDIYTVYGVNMWKGTINYLTIDRYLHDFPIWIPAELFEVIDSRLPSDWYFKFYGYSESEDENLLLNVICGYKELVMNEGYYTQLINREDTWIFNQRRKEIDAFHNNLTNEQIE
jgi:hypothetical protein